MVKAFHRASQPVIRVTIAIVMGSLLALGASSAFAGPRTPGTPRPTVTPIPRPTVTPPAPAPVGDAASQLATCALNSFGLTPTYVQSGGMTSTELRSLSIPTDAAGTISASVNAGATAVYGLTSTGGVQILSYGNGASAGVNTSSISLSGGQLCYLQLPSSQAMPSSSADTLKLLKATFPGVPQRSPYVTKSTTNGYVFVVGTVKTVDGVKVTQSIVLSAQSTPSGLLLSALAEMGNTTSSTAVK